jgi:hypothetical protein
MERVTAIGRWFYWTVGLFVQYLLTISFHTLRQLQKEIDVHFLDTQILEAIPNATH